MTSRIVHTADGVAWLREHVPEPGWAIVTSLPDSSEQRKKDADAWERWFVETATLVCRSVTDDAVAIFFQTDVKREGVWVDKAFLVQLAAREAGSACLWHKIVCRAPAGTATHGRPGFAHLLCFSRGLRLDPKSSSADVIPELGDMPWPRAMGTAACSAVAGFLLRETSCRTVVDPFCGMGTMLAVANAHGLDAIGIERSPTRAERARTLSLD